MSWTKAVVTGASSGIGEAIARRLADAGTHVVLVARTKDRLDALAEELGGGDHATVHVADLGEPRDVAEVAELITNDADIDLVVNNAGFGVTAPVIETDAMAQLGMIDVNVRCLTQLSHAAGVAMAERGRGGILNISSVAGYAPTPESAVYGATKAFVSSFSQALHMELKPAGIHVACVAPGFTRTEFQERADYDTSGLPGFLWQTADDVAAVAIDAVDANKPLVVSGMLNKTLVGSVKPMPGFLQRRIAKAF